MTDPIGIVFDTIIFQGDLYIAGDFIEVDGASGFGSIAKWDGAQWDDVGAGVDDFGVVLDLEVFDGKLYVGGDFPSVGGAVEGTAGIARWTGSEWESVGGGFPGQFSHNVVQVLAVFKPTPASNPRLYAASGDELYDGEHLNLAAFITTSSDTWTFVVRDPELIAQGTPSDRVDALYAWDQDGDGVHEALYMGGEFDTIFWNQGQNEIEAFGIVRWDGQGGGASFSDLDGGVFISRPNTTGSVRAIIEFDHDGNPNTDRRLFAGGEFNEAGLGGPDDVESIAMWDGQSWFRLADGGVTTASGGIGGVFAFAIRGGIVSRLVVGGSFVEAGDNTGVEAVAEYTQSQGWASNIFGNGVNGEINGLSILGSDLFAGGLYNTANCSFDDFNNIGRWAF